MITSTELVPARVIHGEDLRDKILEITKAYALVAARTYGPYGGNALIQSGNKILSTKDGWFTVSSLGIDDDIPTQTLGKLILDTAASVNLKVGDGTTTVIEAAYEINKSINDYLKEHNTPSRDVEDALEEVLHILSVKLDENKKLIDVENPEEVYDIIKKIALISTNWNEGYADMIASIYKNTGNPIINVQDSGTDKTYVEYTEGFEVNAELFLRDYYFTDREKLVCELENPLFLMFDHTIQKDMFMPLSLLSQAITMKAQRPFVIIAPGYMDDFVSAVKYTNINNIRQKQPILNLQLVKTYAPVDTDKDIVEDLSLLLGASMIGSSDDDVKKLFEDVTEAFTLNDDGDKKAMSIGTLCDVIMNDYIGTCDSCVITKDKLQVIGLSNADMDIINQRVEKITAEIERHIEECDSMSMITVRVRQYRIRLGKLRGKMGTIKVGGYGASNLKSRRDSLDDAIKACQAAYEYGYTIGGVYAIPHAINNTIPTLDNTVSQLTKDFLSIIKDSLYNVICTIWRNKYPNLDNEMPKLVIQGNEFTLKDAIDSGISSGIALNIKTEDYDPDLIEPISEEIEILKGCMRLVMLASTSNQYLYANFMKTPDFLKPNELN